MVDLFDLLDLDRDGLLSRSELHTAARRLSWHWREAPFFALLDLLATPEPLTKKKFITIAQQIFDDPMGPYGSVLLSTHRYIARFRQQTDLQPSDRPDDVHDNRPGELAAQSARDFEGKMAAFLDRVGGSEITGNYMSLLKSLGTCHISTAGAAMLIIDPQSAFTEGAWMKSIGPGAIGDVKPIVMAFNNCAKFLYNHSGGVEIMFSRCPFPPDSYNWDERVKKYVDPKQPYFIKPGNSILFPPTNGYKQWVARCIDAGKRWLVIGGCTLNSCVRASAIETRAVFDSQELQIVVDMSLSGARGANYFPAQQYDGLSGVASAVRQMEAAGVRVVRCVRWGRD